MATATTADARVAGAVATGGPGTAIAGVATVSACSSRGYVTELTDLIKVKSQDSASDEEEDVHFVRYFPQFIWAVRDFTLELKIEGVSVSADQYLEHALSLKKGIGKKVSDYNLPRECIRRYFPSRRCFVFVAPTAGENMSRVESMEENELSAAFLQAAKQFCEYIFTQSTVKTIKGGHKVTGRMLGSLVSTYVDTISSGSVPCLDNAVLAMAQIENKAAVQQGLAVYQKGMEQSMEIPVTRDRMSEQHGKWEKQALETFMKRSFKDDGHIHQKTPAEQVISHYTELVKRNDDVSIETCNKVLVDLSVQMSHNLQQGVYATPGGYKLYCEDRDHVVQQFRATPNKGTKAEDVLDQFLKQKKIEAASILLADQKLTENEKQIASEREHAFQMEQQNKAMEEEARQMKCTLEEEQRSHAENQQQMELKLQEEIENARKEHERALESKLKEQEELMKKGFEEKATMLQEEISQLKKESKSWLDVAKTVLETGEREHAFQMEQQNKAMEEEARQMKCTLEEEQRSHAENQQQMELKLQEEIENACKEHERALESKLKEQEQLMKKGFEEKATMLQEEISQLKKESTSWLDVTKTLLEAGRDICNSLLQYKSMSLLKRK
ncbi:UNVERIFIED_CONTAM: hypothetical protein FKN15_009975 [Acipenser sinensis]